MKCSKHNAEGIGICSYCGRAVCGQCQPTPESPRLVCSMECRTALERTDRAMEMILQKSVQGAKANAFYCYLCAALSAGAAVGAYFTLPSPFLIWFTGGCAAAFGFSGFWFGRIARQKEK